METIKLEMTWRAAAPMLLAVLADGTAEGRNSAREELGRMADTADRARELAESVAVYQAVKAKALGAMDRATDSGGPRGFWRAAAFAEMAAELAEAGADKAGATHLRQLAERKAAMADGQAEAERAELAGDLPGPVAAALTDAAAMLGVYTSGRSNNETRGQALATIRQLRAAQGLTRRPETPDRAAVLESAIRDALALLQAPHYGQTDKALDHASDAAARLAEALS